METIFRTRFGSQVMNKLMLIKNITKILFDTTMYKMTLQRQRYS